MLNTVDEGIEAVRQGKIVIVVDDENRENEGDFIVSGEKITPDIVNFMITHGRGLLCVPLPRSRCKELQLPPMVTGNIKPSELARPGHIFPLYGHEDGVLGRDGHTEALLDLTRMAGLTPGGALIEILNQDGTMARLPQLLEMAKKFRLKIIAIKDIQDYRRNNNI